MGRRYEDELQELESTFERARDYGAAVSDPIQSGPALFVGSGGALACARFAADLHQLVTGHLASALTPATAVSNGPACLGAAVFFSARARHSDLRNSALALRGGAKQLVLMTHLETSELSPVVASLFDVVLTVPRGGKDGFLATNSVLAMTTAYAALRGFVLPDRLPALETHPATWPSNRTRLFVAHAPEHAAVAVDLEARFNETGVATAQIADLRNVAHGRHVALSRNVDDSVVISVAGPESLELCERTLALLAPAAHIPLRTHLAGPAGTLDLLAASMRAFAGAAAASKFDPGRPAVPQAGRRLYHLSWRTGVSRPPSRPERLKLQAGALSDPQEAATAVKRWKRSASRVEVEGLVLDYDGTCVSTDRRFEHPRPEVQHELLRALDGGLRLGFASGRGKSLPDGLAEWVPQAYWSQIWIGTYNGGFITKLGERLPVTADGDGALRALADTLERELGAGWTLTRRAAQISVERAESRLELQTVARWIGSVIARMPEQRFKVMTSGHSLDVVPTSSSKVNVLSQMNVASRNILAIGDQGQFGGNDFELLAATAFSLSVDAVSSDLSRCWNLSSGAAAGPSLLVQYLQGLAVRGGVARWEPSDL